jgi:hypothetical protein
MDPPRPPEAQAEDLCKFLAPHLESFNWAVTAGLAKLQDWLLPVEVKDPDSGTILTLTVTEVSLSSVLDSRDEKIFPFSARLSEDIWRRSRDCGLRSSLAGPEYPNHSQQRAISVV